MENPIHTWVADETAPRPAEPESAGAAHLPSPENATPSYFVSVADAADAMPAVPVHFAAAADAVASTGSASSELLVPRH